MLLLHQTIPREAILYSIRQNTIFDSVFFKNQGVLDVTNLWIGGLEVNNLPLKFWEKDKGKASLHYSKICSKYSFLSVVACENSFFSSPLVKDIVRGSMAWSQWEGLHRLMMACFVKQKLWINQFSKGKPYGCSVIIVNF